MYFVGFFQTDVLINSLIPLRLAEAKFHGKILSGKSRSPEVQKGWNFRLVGMKLSACNCKMQIMENF